MRTWKKSSRSGSGSGSNCVEVSPDQRVTLVRDTKDREGGTLAVSGEAWARFVKSL